MTPLAVIFISHYKKKMSLSHKKNVPISGFLFVGLNVVLAVCPVTADSRFLFTENVQFSYVSLRCTSAGQRTRSRHGRRAGEEDGSSITAEFELDVNLEEVTGWSLCAPPLCLPACLLACPLLLSLQPFPCRCCFRTAACLSLIKP